MRPINYISLALLILFLASYLLKLIILKRKDKIKAYVLGKAGKDKSIHFVEIFVKISSLAGFTVWGLEALFGSFLTNLKGWTLSKVYSYSGLILTALGVLFFILAILFMKSSWRVGIDKETKSSLITDGIYKISRNPAFVGFDLMFIGLFLTFPSLFTLLVAIINLIAFHLLILQEEKHLTEIFGKQYIEYKQSTPRYLLIGPR